tara:strand:+ start:1515 stop:2567 length:1053 start_codon:yes stop_codon:yes gene_type:complete
LIKNNIWKNKKVFLTGDTGFKGSWLSIWLNELGAIVEGYSLRPDTIPSLYESANINNLHNTHFQDIRDLASLKKAVSDFKPDIVMHLAAQPLVRSSYINPIETLETNVIGTANVLSVSKDINSVQVVLVITSDKCYENNELGDPFKENDRMGGADPYSCSKGCAELVVASYQQSYYQYTDKKLMSARAGNVIGGGDWSKDRLIPDIIRAVSSNSDLHLRNPGSIRPWQHVLEPLDGYIELCEKALQNEGFDNYWNFGPYTDDVLSVEDLAISLKKYFKSNSTIKHSPSNLKESNVLKLDVTKALTELDWEPRLTTDKCLEWVANWYKDFQTGSDPYLLCKNQIKSFEELK